MSHKARVSKFTEVDIDGPIKPPPRYVMGPHPPVEHKIKRKPLRAPGEHMIKRKPLRAPGEHMIKRKSVGSPVVHKIKRKPARAPGEHKIKRKPVALPVPPPEKAPVQVGDGSYCGCVIM
ncbi:hypothetical protein BELL_0270g00010 [Botrytis elliptica]|uniref:Uncharacterized protein n=1 Tax=Botrytis elliptica TaxID=278938 RepID=A0A4Z1K043_9HELO|nr:hypothetical protein BELL_0270g00010 [Botrytis elliptica]